MDKFDKLASFLKNKILKWKSIEDFTFWLSSNNNYKNNKICVYYIN